MAKTTLTVGMKAYEGLELVVQDEASYSKEHRETSQQSQHRGLRKRIEDIISNLARLPKRMRGGRRKSYEPSQIDTTLAGQEFEHVHIPELDSSEVHLIGCHSADQKDSRYISEMSSVKEPVELYSPLADSGRMTVGGRDEVEEGEDQGCGAQNNPSCTPTSDNTLHAPAAEISGGYWHGWQVSTTAGAAMPPSSWSGYGTELPLKSHSTTPSLPGAAQPMKRRVQSPEVALDHQIPGLSPQTSSHQSWPTSPETPILHGDVSIPSRSSHWTSFSRAVSPYESTVSPMYPAQCGQSLKGKSTTYSMPMDPAGGTPSDFNFPTPAAQRYSNQQAYAIDQRHCWQQEFRSLPFDPPHGRGFQENQFASCDVELPNNTITEPVLGSPFTQPQPSWQRAFTSPSLLPAATHLPISNSQMGTGIWPTNDQIPWTLGDENASTSRADDVANRIGHDIANMISSSEQAQDSDTCRVDEMSKSETTWPPAKCKHCKQDFTGRYGKGNRTRHVKQKHQNRKPKSYKCRICGEHAYNRSDARHTHERKCNLRLRHAPPKKVAR